MSMSDPIADMLTRIRNAQMVEKAERVDAVVEGEGRHRPGPEGRGLHRRTSRSRGEGGKPELEIAPEVLRRPSGDRAASSASARPGLRVYKGRDDIPQVMNGLGVAIVTDAAGRDDRPQGARHRHRRRSALLRRLREETAHVPRRKNAGRRPARRGRGRSAPTRSASRARSARCRARQPAGQGQERRRQAERSSPANDSREADAMSGTMRALVTNMVNGVTKGFEKKLTWSASAIRAQAAGRQAEPAARLLASGRQGHAGRHQGRDADADRDRDQGRRPPAVGQVAAEVRAYPPARALQGQGHPLRGREGHRSKKRRRSKERDDHAEQERPTPAPLARQTRMRIALQGARA